MAIEFNIGDNIIFWQKYNPFELSFQSVSNVKMLLDNPIRICIKGVWYDTIPLHGLYYLRNEADKYWRFIYIQINMNTFEYYIGKVNRKRWNELKRYQGSGKLFMRKYKNHTNEFVRYYIASCCSAKETEELEASIVDEELLKDSLCLNLTKGGSNTNHNGRSEKSKKAHSEMMKQHPEYYRALVESAAALYCSGNTPQLEARNKSIRETMSSDKYRTMSRDRIKNWKENNPEAYAQARKNNRLAVQKPKVIQKQKESRKRFAENNPEKYQANINKFIERVHTEEAEEKRLKSIIKWNREHPEEAKANAEKRSKASVEACRKAVNMLDLETGEALKAFESQHAAADWLVKEGIAKTKNCVTSISSVCLKKPCTTGYGYRKKAYGYGWEFSEK